MSLSAPAQLMLEAYPDLRRRHKGLCAMTAVRIVRGCGVNACARNEKKADAEQSMTSSTDGGQPKLFLEDLRVGQRFLSRTQTLDAGEIKAFAATYDPQPFHLDEDAARRA